MKLPFRSFQRCLAPALWLVLLTAGLARAAAVPQWALRPEWWDGVKVRLESGATPEAAADRSLARPENRAAVTPLENGWRVLGPFPCWRDEATMNAPSPGEELDFRKSYPGCDGKPVSWQAWTSTSSWPAPAVADQFSALFYVEFPGATGARSWLALEHDDGALVFLNDRLVYKQPAWTGEPATVPVTLRAQNRLLVRLNQTGGNWNIKASLAAEHPLWREIKIRTEAVASFLDAKPAAATDTAIRLGQLYTRLGDMPNSLYWYGFAIQNRADENEAMRWFREACDRLKQPELDDVVIPFCRSFSEGRRAMPELCRLAALQTVDRLYRQRHYQEALDWLQKREAVLRPLLGPRWEVTQARILVAKGEWKRAAELIRPLPAESNDREYKDALNNVRWMIENSQSAVVQMSFDVDLEQVKREIAQLGSAGATEKLHRLIRQTLQERALLWVETDDPALLEGAAGRCRDLLRPLAATYDAGIKDYAAVLNSRLGRTPAEAEAEVRRISLAAPVPVPSAPTWQDAGAPAPRLDQTAGQGFAPRLLLAAGPLEMRLDETPQPWGEGGSLGATGFCPGAGNTVFLQNSRSLCRFDGARMTWRRDLPDRSLAGVDKGHRILGSGFAPKSDGRRVFARLLADGRFTLFAFDAADGALLWRWNEAGDAFACSDPVLSGGTVLFLAAHQDTITRYSLVVADAATGATQTEYPLCSTGPERDLQDFGTVRPDWFMPEPAVRHGMAFVDTGLGLIAAVNLNWRCLQWARKVPRLPANFNRQMADLVLSRRACPPVPGRETVLFTPRDGAGMLLLDLRTGKLLREDAGRLWTDCRPCGEDGVLVRDGEGAARILSLRDLSETAKVPGQVSRLLAACRDGVLLVRSNGAVELRDPAGACTLASPALPPDFQPLGAAGGDVWGFQPAAPAPMLGVISSVPGAALPAPAAADPEPGTEPLINPALVRDGSDIFIVSDLTVLRLNAALRPVWSWTAPGEPPAMELSPRTVWLTSRGGLQILDRETGRIVGRIPAVNKSWRELRQIRADGDTLLAAVRQHNEWQTFNLVRITRDGDVTDLGRFPGQDMRGLFHNGDAFVWHDNQFRIYRRGADGKFTQSAAVPGWWEAPILPVAGDAFMVTDRRKVLIAKDGRFQQVDAWNWGAAGGNESWDWRWARDRRREQSLPECLPVRYWEQGASLFNGRTFKDMAETVRFRPLPFPLTPTLFTGILAEPTDPKKPAPPGFGLFDTVANRLLYRKPALLLSLVEDWTRPTYDISIRADDGSRAWHFFNLASQDTGRLPLVAVDDLKPDTPLQLFPFPLYAGLAGGVVRGDTVLLLVDDRLVRFTAAEFAALLAGRGEGQPALTPLAAKKDFRLTVDGYLDEWDPAAFVPGRGGTYAVVWSPGPNPTLSVALRLTDPDLIRTLARRGAEGRLLFRILHASQAGFRPELAATQGTELLLGRDAEGCAFNYAVTPDGSALTAEVSLPLAKASKLDFNRWKELRWRERISDLAFDFRVLDGLGGDTGVLAPRAASGDALPVNYPRILLKLP